LRLLAGLALIGADDLAARLHEWETGHLPVAAGPGAEPVTLTERGATIRALVGLAFHAADTTARAMSATAGVAQSVASWVAAPLRPVVRSPLVRPIRRPIEALAARGQKRYERLVRTGLAEERRTRRLAEGVTGLLMADVVEFAGENPGVKRLVDAQVDRLLPSLVADPTIQELLVQQLGEWLEGLTTRSETLDPLVRGLGDRYIAYLNEHPEDVQNLVQGQAMSMAGEVRDSVRTLTVTGDSFVEAFARGLLRRPLREDLSADQQRRYGNTSPTDGAVTPGESAL
jgi:hypothetical protein